MKIRTSSRYACVSLFSIALIACSSNEATHGETESAAKASAATSATLNLVASIDTPTGSTAEWYEPTPGSLLFSEVGSTQVKSYQLQIDLKKMRAVDIYKAIAPNATVPQALIDAQDRQTAKWAASDGGAPSGTHDFQAQSALVSIAPQSARMSPLTVPAGDPNVGCSPPWFYNNVNEGNYFCNTPNWSSSWCFYDTGPGAWVTSHGINQDDAAVCAIWADSILLNVTRTNDEGSLGNIPILSQTWRNWWAVSGCGWFSCDSYDYYVTLSGTGGDMQFAGGVIYN